MTSQGIKGGTGPESLKSQETGARRGQIIVRNQENDHVNGPKIDQSAGHGIDLGRNLGTKMGIGSAQKMLRGQETDPKTEPNLEAGPVSVRGPGTEGSGKRTDLVTEVTGSATGHGTDQREGTGQETDRNVKADQGIDRGTAPELGTSQRIDRGTDPRAEGGR